MENKKKALIAGLYVRVSTNKQEEEATIDSQIDEIKQRIAKDGNILPPENIFVDDGWTGEMLQRPDLDSMRDAAMMGKLEALYVYDRGRISRVFAYQEIIIEELTNKGVEFVTLHDIQAQTPEERVLQAMQGVFHEYERVKIAERMRRGKLFKAKNGIIINGSALYGYDYIKKTEKDPTSYRVNEEEARVVKMIWEWFGVERVSIREIIRRLYDLKILPRKRKNEFWTKGPITRILKCETYVTGIAYYNKGEAVVAKNPLKNVKYKRVKRTSRRLRPKEDWIPFKVPTVINDRNLFEHVQKLLIYNQKYASKRRKYPYLFSGLVKCDCGSPRVGDGSDGKNYYYRCADRIYKFPLKTNCKLKGINAIELDNTLWKELVKQLNNPVVIEKYAVDWLKAQANNNADKQEVNRLNELIGKTKDEEGRFTKAYGEGALEFEKFKELIKNTKRIIDSYYDELSVMNNKITHSKIDKIQLKELVDEAKRVINKLDLTNKFQIVRDIIDEIIVKGGNTVEVRGHLPLPTVNMGYELINRNCRFTKCREVYIV